MVVRKNRELDVPGDEASRRELPQGERRCLQCQEVRSLIDFARQKGRIGGYRKICQTCEYSNQHERHRRVALQREGSQQQGREESRLKEWNRRVAFQLEHEERWRERELWHLQQPDRRCQTCRQILPSSAFRRASSSNSLTLQTRCLICHDALQAHHQLACCLCQQKRPRNDFISCYNGYALCGEGTWISLCCQSCEPAFQALSSLRQGMYIRACCQRSFPVGQVIYAEVEPETGEIRYIGRTGQPKRRHAQHLCDTLPMTVQQASPKKVWYTRSNWMYSLAEKGLQPSMRILLPVDVAPLVVEWEQRYIWYGLQQGWKLLNIETLKEEMVVRAKTTPFDFLTAPFELLVQQEFFSSNGLVAFLHNWYQPECIRS